MLIEELAPIYFHLISILLFSVSGKPVKQNYEAT